LASVKSAVPCVKFDELIVRLQKAAEALSGGGYLDLAPVSFFALKEDGGRAEKIEIVSSAYRQIEMFKRGLIGPKPAPVPYSPKYLKRRISKGFPPVPYWTLVWRGVLYKSLAYYVRGRELYVEYDERRRDAVRYLSRRVGFHVLDVPQRQLLAMSAAFRAASLQKFVEIMRGRYG
jgi:hypothetical protein